MIYAARDLSVFSRSIISSVHEIIYFIAIGIHIHLISQLKFLLIMRRTAGFTLWDYKRIEDVLHELKMKPIQYQDNCSKHGSCLYNHCSNSAPMCHQIFQAEQVPPPFLGNSENFINFFLRFHFCYYCYDSVSICHKILQAFQFLVL